MKNDIDSAYIARCHKTLKSWGAPLDGWYCVDVLDIADEDGEVVSFATCELCNCNKVRYIHVMRNDDYFEDVEVGCICAGIMEGDILAARERERLMKNRAKRKQNFPRRKWKLTRTGNGYLNYKGKRIFINKNTTGRGTYNVFCEGQTVWNYKGRPIDNFLSAAYAAFDLVDPIEEVMES